MADGGSPVLAPHLRYAVTVPEHLPQPRHQQPGGHAIDEGAPGHLVRDSVRQPRRPAVRLELVSMHPQTEGALDLLVDEESIALEGRVPRNPADEAADSQFDPRTRLDATRPLHDANRREGGAQQRQGILPLVEGKDDIDWGVDEDLPHEDGHTA